MDGIISLLDRIDVNSLFRRTSNFYQNFLLVPYSRKPFTQFSPYALRGIKNKKSGEYFKIRILK
jgi:hypothetical protein